MLATPVLIVDDSSMIIKIIKKALLMNSIDGHYFEEETIYTAYDGMEAFEAMGRGHAIKLIISDINMPHLNGDEFIEILQDTGKLEELSVVFVTSSATKLTLSSSIKKHTLGIIYKPFRFDSFCKQLIQLQEQKKKFDIDFERQKEIQFEQKKHIEKVCLIYLEELKFEWITTTLDVLIDETFEDENISEDEYPEVIYSILSTYLFEEEEDYKIDTKKILCIMKNNRRKASSEEDCFK